MLAPPVIDQRQERTRRTPLWIATAANLLVALLSVQFYWVPRGAAIRPMAWAAWVGYLSIGAVIALIVSIPALKAERRGFWVWATILLSVTPWLVGTVMLHHAASMRQLILEP